MKPTLSALLLIAAVLLAGIRAAEEPPPPAQDRAALRAQYQKNMKDGNWKNAYEGLSKLAVDPDNDPKLVGQDLQQAIQCLRNLNRIDECDDFREKVIAAHANNWRLLSEAAQSYASEQHYGYIVAGKFSRGHRRGQGKYVSSVERDRVRALQLMTQALEKSKDEPDKQQAAQFHHQLAQMMLFNGQRQAWQLQVLTDISTLPDYDEQHGWYGGARGAAVEADGTPVYHKLPKTFADAKSDGERWRYALMQVMELNPARANEVRMQFASFQQGQFDVRTMQYYGRNFGRGGDDDANESGPFALKTLAEDETIARLATGIKRFKLPDEFNYIKIYQQIANEKAGSYSEQALNNLAQIFEDRQQYPKAAEYWKRSIAEHGDRNNAWKAQRLEQITGNWGMFEAAMTQPSGKGAILEYRFRNANKVSFDAQAIDIKKLLEDVKAHIRAKPANINWEVVDLNNLGYRLVEKNQGQYLGEKVAAWELDLKPRENHFDRRVSVATPLQKAGAYLVTARLANGNTSRVIAWIADTTIVKKPLSGKTLCYVADAVTGAPIAGAKVDFFGYRQTWNNNTSKIEFTEISKDTAADGQATLDAADGNSNSWVITATTPEGRLAYLGFTHIWHGQYYDHEYNQTKIFGITDRPVYRPKQPVKFKVWIGEAKYDMEGASRYANQTHSVTINNPKGEKVFEKSFTTDQYGGFDGQFELESQATLGQYYIQLPNIGHAVAFRVEEYKKPEFEVKVDAPTEPVMLGEKVTATLNAKYYFGAPVSEGKVKYKVMRTSHTSNWYPSGRWDWFYQPGYWWFGCDYGWYPGFYEWGCKRPRAWWWNGGREQPELLVENEVPIPHDGSLKIEIDTALARAMHGNSDHKYEITAEVTDQSRRTIVGSGSVMVARKPFKVYGWVDKGHYRTGDAVEASFSAQTLASKPVKGKGLLKLLKIAYDKESMPVETAVQEWQLDTNDEGTARQQLKAAEPGQYRLSYTLTDEKQHKIEGGYVFTVSGEGFDGSQFRFNDIELVVDKKEYAPGDKVQLMINTNRTAGTVLLFVRPANSIYLPPTLLRLQGKSIVHTLEVAKKDMPNFFVEAVTVANGKVFSEMKEIVVPPESRVVNVEVLPNTKEYKPGEKAKVKVKLTDNSGEPISASSAITVYDKSVEYIAGGSNVPEIKSFFWKWRRRHYPGMETTLQRSSWHIGRNNEKAMSYLGAFGALVADADDDELAYKEGDGKPGGQRGGFGGGGESLRKKSGELSEQRAMNAAPAAPMAAAKAAPMEKEEAKADAAKDKSNDRAEAGPGGSPADVEPTVRSNFADTAYWAATVNTGVDGIAEFEMTMPENLTTWRMKVWSMGAGSRVGQGETDVITKKNVIVRLQAPRFFQQKDEVVLSANVHNYLKTKKPVKVSLEVNGQVLEAIGGLEKNIDVDTNGEQRVDWRVKVLQSGEASVRVKAITDEESDAMEVKFPAYIKGMMKTDSFSGNIRPDKDTASVTFNIPAERRAVDTRGEVRYSPTLAGSMVDALPYLVDYPYGCTEQTLSRFLPTVITQKVLQRMNINLKDVQEKITNLNAQEIGDDKQRATQWKRYDRNPVFDEAEVRDMVRAGIERLGSMQCADGGWGWFSGRGEQSYPHTTAYVVHGLQTARNNDVALPPNMLERGVEWLKGSQNRELQRLKLPKEDRWHKSSADNMDAFTFMVMVDANVKNDAMMEFLYRDRNNLSVYAKSMFGIALHRLQQKEKLAMITQNIDQFLVQDDENQTAYLKLPENQWWYWYGSEYEAQAYYLKLLAASDPKNEKASRLVKYLINNRKHASYWNSTRDTALCIEALGDYMKASGEDKPDMNLEVLMDGKKIKEVAINGSNLFTFDNKVVMTGEAVPSGKHTLEFKKKGTGPLYFNAYASNFTLEDHIGKAGLEIKVDRKYYKLKRVDKEVKVEGARGQAVGQKVEKYEREELPNLSTLKSGDLVEIELEIDSKNDYEYILFEDMKAAGFEPVDVRSGYSNNDMGAYMELRDERVCFFVRQLARGKHSVAYRMRAEIPGKFSALPTRASAMYAPELKANSDEIKVEITD